MKLYKGDDWAIPFSYRKENDVFDITDITEMKSCFKGDTAVVEVLLSTGEIVITSAEGGNGVINVPKAKTATIKKGKQDLTVIRTDNTGKEYTHVIKDLLEIEDRPC